MTRSAAPRILFAATVVSTAAITVAPADAAPRARQGTFVGAVMGRVRAAPARALLRPGAVPDGTAVAAPLLTAGARPACSNHQGKGPARRMCEVVAGVTDHYGEDDQGMMAFEVRTCTDGDQQINVYADGHASFGDSERWTSLGAEDPRQSAPAIARCRQGTL